MKRPTGRTSSGLISKCWRKRRQRGSEGFTLVELLIVVTILPLVVGGLAVGLLSVFSLQSSVSNRLGNTADSQVVSSHFENDVQSAAEITTAPSNSSAECGPANEVQLLGLEWNPFSTGGAYQNVVSYADVQNGTSYSLVRYYCSAGFSNTTYTTTIISYNVNPPCPATACQGPATVSPSAVATAASTAWTLTQPVTKVEFFLAEPSATEANGNFLYTLAAVPAASAAVTVANGAPITPATTTGCGFASPGTGTYASTLCFVDFSSLTGNNLLAAEQGCLEMSVALPGGSTMYFCIGITGVAVYPAPLPTWQNAFLGNTCSGSSNNNNCSNGSPFYTGIAGKPAIYQTGGGTTTVKISQITVVNAQGVPATGWEVVAADAESTDSGESISFNSTSPLTIMNNGESYDTQSDPVGNACNSGAGLTQSQDLLTVTCTGQSTSGVKTGTTMVWSLTPQTFTTTLVGAGLEAMAFGLLLS
ncbi:MAG TPA: CshA/CshB family fibrillar adhesin-related protein [Acidimicrobiales bacterium]|nr:CshA/CshB family fibrillar adhesin-related protein [Acidimicrobiales bacterium]